MGRESDNYTAEMLVKQLGALYAGRGTTAAGARVMRAALGGGRRAARRRPARRRLRPLGLDRLDRGRRRRAARGRARRPASCATRSSSSLAVAGVDGTLEDRLERDPRAGSVIAKTGTTSRASALSGFVRDRYVFAVLQNGRPVSTYWAREAQDRFATVLGWRRPSS